MNKKNEFIEIVCSCDDNFVQHCGVMLNSLFSNTREPKKIRINLFYLKNRLSKNNQLLLEKLVDEFDGKINFFCNDKIINLPKITDYISQESYLRIFAPDYLKNVKKFVYLDCDLVVLTDIRDLWKIDLEKFDLGAVNELVNYLDWAGVKDKDIFNAGVLVINSENFRKKEYSKKISQVILNNHKKFSFGDQDALNIFFNGKWKRLNPKWNLHSFFFIKKVSKNVFNEYNLKEIMKKPSVVHFTGVRKPWHYLCVNPFVKYYWVYIRNTPWEDFKVEGKTVINFFKKIYKLVDPNKI
jgi:lipopolysaccharide biosynthesis glycosyltransferase